MEDAFFSLDDLHAVREERLSPLTAAARLPDSPEHLGDGAINVLAGSGETFDPPLEWGEWHDYMVSKNFVTEDSAPVAERTIGRRKSKGKYHDPNQAGMFDGQE